MISMALVHWIVIYPADSTYPPFEQLRPEGYIFKTRKVTLKVIDNYTTTTTSVKIQCESKNVIVRIVIIEWFSNDCRKTKTKAINPTNHNRTRSRPLTSI